MKLRFTSALTCSNAVAVYSKHMVGGVARTGPMERRSAQETTCDGGVALTLIALTKPIVPADITTISVQWLVGAARATIVC